MALVSLDHDRVVIRPASVREMGATASAVRRAYVHAVSRTDGSLVCVVDAIPDLALHLPPDRHTWNAEALSELCTRQAVTARRNQVRDLVADALAHPRDAATGYRFLDRLDEHQVDVLAALSVEQLDGLGLFDEQGTGKTISCLCGFDFLLQRGRIDRLLVVSPKSMVTTWGQTASEWLRDVPVTVVAGAGQRVSDQIARAEAILVVTYEVAVRSASLIGAWCTRRQGRTLLVVDESFFVKNPQTERSAAVTEIRRHCAKAIVACGTPAPNSPSDIINQVDIADLGHTFGSLDTLTADSDLIAGTLRERSVYLRRLKRQVLPDLPEKSFTLLRVPMSPRQREMYLQLRDELVVEVRAVDDVTFNKRYATYLGRRIGLLQVCSHPRAIDPSYAETPAKLLALDRLLVELIEHRGEKVVLWSFFTHSLEQLASRYRKYGVARIDGSVAKVEQRADAISRFQHDHSTRLFVGNPAAAGAGITLTAARHAIYESFSNQAAHYLQSLDRIHRRGQARDVQYTVLLCDGTIEVAEYERLLRKERRASELLGDPDAPRLTREAFLAELLNADT